MQCRWIELPADPWVGKDCFDLRSKHQSSVSHGVEQRPDSQTVSSQKKCLPQVIPDGERELTIQTRQTGDSFLFIQVKQDLGIGVRGEAMPFCLQLRTELDVIKDLPVKHNPQRAVLVPDGLLAAAEVDDAQPGASETDVIIQVDPELVGSAMPDHGQHPTQLRLFNGGVGSKIKYARYPAHP
jgi:hypothetical protein